MIPTQIFTSSSVTLTNPVVSGNVIRMVIMTRRWRLSLRWLHYLMTVRTESVSLRGWFPPLAINNVANQIISIFVIASSTETIFLHRLNSWLKQIVFTSHFMMEVDNLIPVLGGYDLEIFGKNDIEKHKCYICRKVMIDAIQLPHLVHPKRTCLTCYTANIR